MREAEGVTEIGARLQARFLRLVSPKSSPSLFIIAKPKTQNPRPLLQEERGFTNQAIEPKRAAYIRPNALPQIYERREMPVVSVL